MHDIKKTMISEITIFHPTENRNLCINELKRISTFPDDFKFTANFSDAVARMGNAVPPKFMEAIALHVEREILSKIDQNEKR
jgi:Site-specific DNA methylase